MTPQDLKNSILQLAIQGKLVEQRPEEGVAEVPAARQHGGREARRHGEIEPPFDIPDSWRWVRLGDCTNYADRKEKVLPSEIPVDAWSLDLEDIEKDTGKIINHCPASARRITGEKVVFHKGQILYSKLRPYLKKILIAPQDGICTPELVPFSAFDGVDPNYLVVVLRSPHVDFAINSVTYGVKMPRVGTETMVNLPIPIPPLPEQHRIVSTIEELQPLIDRYAEAWTKLETFNKRFPEDMQKSLLQLAIQGKLVEQRPEEGTAEELYREILATKNTKKSKKEKPLPPITDDEIPFDIPESWKWVRFGELGQLKSGFAFKSPEYTREGLQVVRISDLEENAIGTKDAVFYPFKDELASYLIVDGSFLICMTGSIGKMAWVKDGVLRYLNQRVGMFIPSAQCVPEYLWSFLHTSHVISGWIRAKTSTNGNIKNSDITELVTPLPPLAEQKRIVAKLEELLPLCERLK